MSSLNPYDHLARQKSSSPSEEIGKLRSEMEGYLVEGCTAESEQRLNQNKDKSSQSKEKGDPLPQEAAARGTGDRNFCRSGKIMLLPNAECRKKRN